MHCTISKAIGFSSLLFILLLSLGACSRSSDPNAQVSQGDLDSRSLDLPGLLVDMAWLADHLGRDCLVVVDARSADDYFALHVEGAASMPSQATFEGVNSYRMPGVSEIATLVSQAGIDHGQSVVVYTSGDLRDAARVLWVLESHGHESVAVLKNSHENWVAAGNSVSLDLGAPPARSFLPFLRPSCLATKASVLESVSDPSAVLVDSRGMEKYKGEEVRWSRNGHIRGARNVEWVLKLDFDGSTFGKLAALDKLRRLFDFEGFRPRYFVTYCDKGRRASLSYLALRILGERVALFDGSWIEWCADPSLPMGP